ncbi:YheV family putative metal-binding protein [Moraxella sp. VT-16-12]|uniref:YheV family putative metal-binding protein n=1 Tax=Moraxella sp. VT-16-12 TaxID=2014877 RepID=UPI000B7F4DAC|nr:YheV family putative metal-binding protein [Moraxella sp. VT-16-12]TWV81303.1 hypothetical protein CEW93_008295 [Moraxella sp. VT-16-12]
MRYQSNRPKRQFLAGVKCSSCGTLDSTVQIQIFEPAFDEYIECVQCGHSERRPTADDLPNIHSENDHNGVSVVRFVPK